MENTQTDSIFTITKAATDKDYLDCAYVTNTLTKSDGVNIESLRHDFENNNDHLLIIARVSEQAAGTLVCKLSSAPQQVYTMIRILPEYRKQRLGDLLYKVASEHAKNVGRISLQGRVKETDPDALAFFKKRGFEEVSKECMVSLFTENFNVKPIDIPADIDIVSLDKREDLWEGAYKVASEGIPDIPAPEPLTVPPFEKWLQSEITAPEVRLDGSFVAIADGRVIGYGGMAETSETTAEHLLTAVVRDWRGKGISKLLKHAQIQWAIKEGIEELVTFNDEENDPIRQLNKGLGYKPHPINYIMRGQLHPNFRD